METLTTNIDLPQLLNTLWDVGWKLLIVALLLGNLKNVPLVWHVRILRGFRHVLRSNRSKTPPSPEQVFQPLITSSRCPAYELDYNMHKSNSTYFSDLDIARCHLLCTLFSAGTEKIRSDKIPELATSKNTLLGIALGAITCNFRKEIGPYESYEMWTRVLTWDDKWMYLLTHFVRKDSATPRGFSLYPWQKPRPTTRKSLSKDNIVIASALSKVVWKKGRKTVTPETMLRTSDLLPKEPDRYTSPESHIDFPKHVSALGRFQEVCDIPFKTMDAVNEAWAAAERTLFATSSKGSSDASQSGSYTYTDEMPSPTEPWTWQKMEEQRLRGMEIAKTLSASELGTLDHAFEADTEALGMQADFW